MQNVHFENRSVSRRFFILLWLMYSMVYMTKNCFSGAMSLIVSEGVMTKSQTGLIVSAFNLAYAPLQILGGIFADKYDPEKLIKIGLIGGGIVNLIIFLNQNYYLVLTVWILNAAVQFSLWPSVFKIVSSQIAKEDRKNSTYYISFCTTAGLLFAFIIAIFLKKWQYNFLFSAVSLFALAIIWHIVTKRLKKHMVPDEITDNVSETQLEETENISAFRLFWFSGYLVLIVIGFIWTVVVNSIKTLSATMLMESYENISPQIGNFLNILIIASGIIGSIIVKEFLYPKRIKSAPVAIAFLFGISLFFAVALLFLGKISVYILVASLCLISGCLSAVFLLFTYCNLRFAKFGKSGIAAGAMNASSALGIVVSGYVIAVIAEKLGWLAVTITFFVLIAVSIGLSLLVIPLWNRFKKKYHSSSMVVKN